MLTVKLLQANVAQHEISNAVLDTYHKFVSCLCNGHAEAYDIENRVVLVDVGWRLLPDDKRHRYNNADGDDWRQDTGALQPAHTEIMSF